MRRPGTVAALYVPQPEIKGRCATCLKRYPDDAPYAFEVISPTGTEHVGEEYGMTGCGKDATRDGWWWRS